MPGIFDFAHRQVVPIWRGFQETLSRGELDSPRPTPPQRYNETAIYDLLSDWDREPNLPVAADLVSAAWSLGLDKAAVDAALFILSDERTPAAARSLARLYLKDAGVHLDEDRSTGHTVAFQSEDGVATVPLDERDFYVEIHKTRGRLALYPRNPILWSNLARLYTTLGVQDKATRAMKVALALAPDNRHVVRAASRLFLHQGEWELAHRTVAGSARVQNDPWLLAAEVATADAIQKTSRHVKRARRIIEAGNHPHFHLSELASAIGTLDACAGNRKSSRHLVTLSLTEPTENSIAQADWLSRKVQFIPEAVSSLSKSPEANTAFALRTGQWELSAREVRAWLIEQPFSSRPAQFGSHLAGEILEDYDFGIRVATLGLLSNPDDLFLHNNLAFCLALKGRLDQAQEIVKNVSSVAQPNAKTVLMATEGLIAFRVGNSTFGRLCYNTAITTFERAGDHSRAVLAKLHLAIEAIRAREPDAEQLRNNALNAAETVPDLWYRLLAGRLQKMGSAR